MHTPLPQQPIIPKFPSSVWSLELKLLFLSASLCPVFWEEAESTKHFPVCGLGCAHSGPQGRGSKQECETQKEARLNLGTAHWPLQLEAEGAREKATLGGGGRGGYRIPSLWCCSGRQLLRSRWAPPHSSRPSSLEWPGVHLQPAQLQERERGVGAGRLPITVARRCPHGSQQPVCSPVAHGYNSAVLVGTAWRWPQSALTSLRGTAQTEHFKIGCDLIQTHTIWEYERSLGRASEVF